VGVQSICCGLSMRPHTLACDQTAICRALVCRLMVSNPVIHVITWITTIYRP